LYVLFSSLLVIHCVATVRQEEDSYAVIVDAGSTGSRGYIFTFTTNEKGKRSIISQKGPKVEPGLSSTETHEEVLVAYFLPIFIEASKYIPEHSYDRTSAYIKGTAGMRLLSDEDQSKLWQAVYHGLSSHPDFKFHVSLNNLGTIDGHMEAYYAVLASNYIEGSIDAELVPQPGTEMVGALDMGGSSTQLICHAGHSMSPGEPVRQADFWSHSWLNFGVERMRDRVWDLITQEYLAATDSGIDGQTVVEIEVNMSGEAASTIQIPNPCTFPGHESLWNDTYLMRGTGNSSHCVQLITQILWPDVDSNNDNDDDDDDDIVTSPADSHSVSDHKGQKSGGRYVDHVPHPPLKGFFYGMSVYFYALDCVRELGPMQLHEWCVVVEDDDIFIYMCTIFLCRIISFVIVDTYYLLLID